MTNAKCTLTSEAYQRSVHAFLVHREVLAPKSLPGGLQDVLNVTIKIVNFVNAVLYILFYSKNFGDVESERNNFLH